VFNAYKYLGILIDDLLTCAVPGDKAEAKTGCASVCVWWLA